LNPPGQTTISYKYGVDKAKVMTAKDTATLSAKFQISIPKGVRDTRHWQAGQVFAFIPKGEGVLLVPVPKLEELAGLARGAKKEGYRDRSDRT
jgi:AbrB family looped-hinge helix DNA binding protein